MLINGERALAYVVTVDETMPLEGYDRVKYARTNGWWCIVGKDEVEVGDKAIYFEIDSLVPKDDERFAFMEKRNYRVKTQKMCKVVSQGLLMPLSLFSELGDLKVGTDVTKILGIKYYEPEDNARKRASDPNAKYKSMSARHPKIAKTKWYRWFMRREWGRRLMFVFFGKKKDKKNTFPAWVVKTDEERCLVGGSKVLTDRGYIQISNIVNNKLPVKVASMNKDGTISYKNILDYQKFDNDKKLITIKYPYNIDCGRTNSICCTEDHKIYTNYGYISAKSVGVGDLVYIPVEAYSDDALEAVYGMLLGDSHIYEDKRCQGQLRIIATNGEKQLDYLNYKRNIFNGDGNISNGSIGSFSKDPSYHWYMNVDPYISRCVRNDWFIDGKKTITSMVIDKITPISLAFWYMDDGCLSYHNGKNHSAWIRLSTQGFSYEENIMLADMLNNKFNISAKVNKDKIAKDGHQMYRIDLTVDSTKDFLKLVAPYMCKSMKYKMPDDIEVNTIELSFNKITKVLPTPVVSVENGQTKNKFWSKAPKFVYDIEVAGNHNFIADGIVVHNCQNQPWRFKEGNDQKWIVTEKIDGTSTTATYRKGRKYGFYICSRNVVFDKPDKKCYYETNVYTEMAEKYHFEDVLKDIVDKFELEWATIQGETYGAGIQKRDYTMTGHDFAAFNLIFSDRGRLNSYDARDILAHYGIPFVPLICDDYVLPATVEEMLEYAEGVSAIDGLPREGVVLRSQDGVDSFKAVSNSFLMKYHG